MGIIEKKFQLILHPTNVLTRRKNKHLELLRSAAKNVTNREGKTHESSEVHGGQRPYPANQL